MQVKEKKNILIILSKINKICFLIFKQLIQQEIES